MKGASIYLGSSRGLALLVSEESMFICKANVKHHSVVSSQRFVSVRGYPSPCHL